LMADNLPTWEEALGQQAGQQAGGEKPLPTWEDAMQASAPKLEPPSPIHDYLFGPGNHEIGRILDAFGHGAQEGWGTEPIDIAPETQQELRRIGIWNDYTKGRGSLIKAFNEVTFRGGAMMFNEASKALNAAFRGGQEAVSQVGREIEAGVPGAQAVGAARF